MPKILKNCKSDLIEIHNRPDYVNKLFDIKKLLIRNEQVMIWADGNVTTSDDKTIYFAKNLQVGLFNNLTYDFGGDRSQDSF